MFKRFWGIFRPVYREDGAVYRKACGESWLPSGPTSGVSFALLNNIVIQDPTPKSNIEEEHWITNTKLESKKSELLLQMKTIGWEHYIIHKKNTL